MTGRWHGLVIDTPDPRGFATFYQELLGFVRVQDDDDWVVIGDAPDRPGLAFQRAPDLEPPGWPGASHRSKCISTSPWTISSRPRSRRSRWALNCSQVAAPPSGSTATRQDIPSACATSCLLTCRRTGARPGSVQVPDSSLSMRLPMSGPLDRACPGRARRSCRGGRVPADGSCRSRVETTLAAS